MGNTTQFEFAGGRTVYVQALADATYTQQVTITPASGAPAVFQGAGGGNTQMPLSTQGFLTPGQNGGQPFFTVPGQPNQLSTYTVAVSYSTNGVSPFQPSEVEGNTMTLSTPAGGKIIIGMVASEDATDNDYNDCVVLFISYPGA